MKNVNLGFIGAGSFVSAHHLLTARDCDFINIAAIADINEEVLKKHSSRMSVGYTTTEYKKLLRDSDIDIVVIGTKQDMHASLIMESLEAGKWVFCEKPMAQTDEEAKAVVQAEQNNEGKLAIGFNRRFAPAYAQAKSLMKNIKKPWYLNYRLMYPNPLKEEPGNYYADQAHIHYEGCHILDLIYWFFEQWPDRVFMTGNRYSNNCCIFDFSDGSQVTFMCGSMGSYCYWKEYMELFGSYAAISVSDFVDMRIRGFKGRYDKIFAPYRNEHAEEIRRFGFDFYEAYKVQQIKEEKDAKPIHDKYGIIIEDVKRPTPFGFDVTKYSRQDEDIHAFIPDKGWKNSLESFANSYMNNAEPENCNGLQGALNTKLAMTLLDSLERKQVVEFDSNF